MSASARAVWIGSRTDVLVMTASRLPRAQALRFDPYALASAIRANWLAERPGARERLEQADRLAQRPPQLRAGGVLFAATLVAYAFEWSDMLFASLGAFEPALVARGEWWRVVTANFLHALAPLHVITTLLALPAFGLLVERPLGCARTVVLMGTAALVSMGACGLVGYERVVGGSGIVAGLAGAVLALELRVPERLPASWRIPRRVFLWALGLQIVLELVLGFGGRWLQSALGIALPSIASAAHAGGFAAGFGLAWFFSSAGLRSPRAGSGVRSLAAAFALLAAVGLASLAPFVWRSPAALRSHAARVLELDSSDLLEANNLAWIMAVEAGMRGPGLELARQLAERAVERSDHRVPAFLDTLAELQFQAGDATAAMDTIDEALAIAPGEAYLAAQRARFSGERAADDRPEDPGLEFWQRLGEPRD